MKYVPILNDTYQLLGNHPDCPNWRGKRKWIAKQLNQLVRDFMNSHEVKIKKLEQENRRLTRERDQARRALEQKVKTEEFLKRVQAGEFSRSLAPKEQRTETAAPAVPSSESGTGSIH